MFDPLGLEIPVSSVTAVDVGCVEDGISPVLPNRAPNIWVGILGVDWLFDEDDGDKCNPGLSVPFIAPSTSNLPCPPDGTKAFPLNKGEYCGFGETFSIALGGGNGLLLLGCPFPV